MQLRLLLHTHLPTHSSISRSTSWSVCATQFSRVALKCLSSRPSLKSAIIHLEEHDSRCTDTNCRLECYQEQNGAMALHVSAQVNGTGTPTPTPAEEEQLYTKLLRLQDDVLHDRHPTLKLPPAAIEQLKATLAGLYAPAVVADQSIASSSTLANGAAFNANAATNHAQPVSTPAATVPTFPRLPGLQTPQQSLLTNGNGNGNVHPPALKPSSSGLDPIFLEKSDSLVRAEGQLKRQRIERDLQAQFEQRKHTARDKDQGADAPSMLNVESIYTGSLARETHVSGLKPVERAGSDTSFDENDYYSSQVQSASFTADYDDPHPSFSTKAAGKQPAMARDTLSQSSKDRPHVYNTRPEPAYEVEDDEDDDEYEPPDPATFGGYGDDIGGPDEGQITPEDDDEDYEPGEITQESNVPTPYYQQSTQPVPVIRNHLTHIAAPQPNRVSPLATAKGPSLELELVNGRPEIVKPRHAGPSRVSTASPVNGAGVNSKKKRSKKRKRDNQPEPAGRSKRKRDKQNGTQDAAYQQVPRIKDEPVSPPPIDATVPEAPQYAQRPAHYRPTEVDLSTPTYAPQHVQYVQEASHPSGLRYEYAPPTSPAVARIASPGGYRPAQKDNQDLRRVASLHHARRPASPGHRAYSPAPQRTVTASYADPRMPAPPPEPQQVRYYEQPGEAVTYVRERSPPRLQEYHDPYSARAQSPAAMPPPPPAAAAPPRRIVVDQYGNRYYAADPEPAPPISRASVAPVDRRAPEPGYERAPSRMATAYGTTSQAVVYEQADARMAPPPPRRQYQDEQTVRYVDANGYPVQQYGTRSEARYMETPTSPFYQAAPTSRYDMAPPSAPQARQASPVYAPPARSYSVRPEAPLAPQAYERQASVAPVQYVRQEAPPPARALSVVPGYEQARTSSYAPAPQAVQYVDQYGRPIYPSEVRQAPAPEYRYQ
ncbi:hypothetical protein AC578_8641 [Pseudocercospora eumusae]|uniref:Uncharacterized protein n=1 Tax=Pseudocercospora eumusae TaxID=321146 RepID=A0A139HPZ0_9PEZI|nr:hypothetical protein AC578_8641 [Pseudocercospora eumusae]